MVDQAFFFEHLFPLQDAVLAVLSTLDTGLYLTGGTAASRGYLHHRFSDDLDLFANDEAEFGLWGDRVVHALAGHPTWSCTVLLREARFIRVALHQEQVDLKIELVNDVPSRVGSVVSHPVLGRLDSAQNILANKITAVLDRSEPKDLADIWGFAQIMGLSVHEAISGAQGKAAGVFPADVARVLYGAAEADWAVVRWIETPPSKQFVEDLQRLAEGLLLGT
jgi:hypothetical protein